jgi:hypothetical protein
MLRLGYLAARADERRQVTGHHARAAAHLEHALARAHGHEAEEPATQPRLRGGAAAHLQRLGHPRGRRLTVDVAPRIGMVDHGGRRSTPAAAAGGDGPHEGR